MTAHPSVPPATEKNATDPEPIIGYGIRECRGHWHVTHGGEDIMIGERDGFVDRDDALTVADNLNRSGPFPPSVPPARGGAEPRECVVGEPWGCDADCLADVQGWPAPCFMYPQERHEGCALVLSPLRVSLLRDQLRATQRELDAARHEYDELLSRIGGTLP